ncbi:hypothetical protein ThvES_00016050 [Thiovulum sp. ES]|nr:hypothetical protein ThvES_00016050 [Thiovulum sp. ES]
MIEKIKLGDFLLSELFEYLEEFHIKSDGHSLILIEISKVEKKISELKTGKDLPISDSELLRQKKRVGVLKRLQNLYKNLEQFYS